ncbi:MAG: type II secretion system protein GspL [Serratia sp. (in: enterobacteria)]|uniref:type II secretion system protein GspL n=1 Tax=Serratia sp. (in: enterobacteria) TaxID=616 RepID=UPI003F393FBE
MSMETKRLILSLGGARDPILWSWGDPAKDDCQQQGQLSEGEKLPEEIRQAPAIVLVPGQHVVLRSTQFHGSPRLAKAQTMAFQCEDELLEEVEELHWVILGHEGASYALAGFHRTEMQNWQELLASLDIRPTVMLPDVLAFPYAGYPTRHLLRQHALWRTGKWSGYCLPQHWSLPQFNVGHPPPAVTDTSTLWLCATTEIDIATTLLKGEFAPSAQWRTSGIWRYWALNAGLALVLGALAMGCFHHYKQAKALRQQMAQTHAQLFSGEETPAKPLAAIKNRIRFLQHQQQQPQFFELAQQLRQALPDRYQNGLQQLKFDGDHGQLSITLNAAAVQPFSRVNEQGNRISLQPIAGENSAILTVKEDL